MGQNGSVTQVKHLGVEHQQFRLGSSEVVIPLSLSDSEWNMAEGLAQIITRMPAVGHPTDRVRFFDEQFGNSVEAKPRVANCGKNGYHFVPATVLKIAFDKSLFIVKVHEIEPDHGELQHFVMSGLHRAVERKQLGGYRIANSLALINNGRQTITIGEFLEGQSLYDWTRRLEPDESENAIRSVSQRVAEAKRFISHVRIDLRAVGPRFYGLLNDLDNARNIIVPETTSRPHIANPEFRSKIEVGIIDQPKGTIGPRTVQKLRNLRT